MKRTMIIALVALLAVTAAWTVSDVDARRGRREHRMKGHHRAEMMKALAPTPEQQEKLKSIHFSHQKKMAQMRADLQVARLDLRAAMDKDIPESGQVKAAVAKVNEARARMLTNRIEHQISFKEILTPEQREKLKEIRMNRPFRNQEHWRGPGMRNRGMRGRGMGGGHQGYLQPDADTDHHGQGI